MIRQFVFNGAEDAQGFLGDIMLQAGGFGGNRRRNLSGIPVSRIQETAVRHKGVSWYRSSHGRETFLHNRLQTIYEEDREYLYKRMPLARSLCKNVARDTWFRPPKTGDKQLDAFLSMLRGLGFNRTLIAADARQRRSGYSFLYVNAGGERDQPIDGVGEWFGFDYIHPGMIDWDKTEMGDDPADKRLAAGVLRLALRPTGHVNDAAAEQQMIHGSRLIPLYEDEDARHIDKAESMLDVIYDSLWDLLDIQFCRNNTQVSGNPIVIELDTESVTDINDDEAQDIMDMAVEVRSGARDAFGPIKGLTIKRVGKSDLEDPEWGLRITVGAISAATEYSANQIMPFSRGSRQMEPEDDVEYLSELMIRNDVVSLPIYQRAIMLAKLSRFAKPRLADFPLEVEWPYLRYITPRDKVFILKGKAQALAQAASAGRRMPEGFDEEFPEDKELRKAMLEQQTMSDLKPRSIAEVMAELEADLESEAFGDKATF